MVQRRPRQANPFGPAGFVSADNGEVVELSQRAFATKTIQVGASITATASADASSISAPLRSGDALWRMQLRPPNEFRLEEVDLAVVPKHKKRAKDVSI